MTAKTISTLRASLFLFITSLQSQESISLKGNWNFRLDPENIGLVDKWFEEVLPDDVSLPGSWMNRESETR